MIVVPLFTPPPVIEGWHQVAAPGGYEWWGVDAHDHTGRLRIAARFYHGYPFHPAYARQYAKYRRRPTKYLPPTADQFPCVHFAVYEDQKLVGQFLSQYPPDAFVAAIDRLDVKIGPNHLSRHVDGSVRLSIGNGAGASKQSDTAKVESAVQAELAFVPTMATSPVESKDEIDPRHLPSATNGVPVDGLAGVSGTIDLSPSHNGGAEGRRLTFNGVGFRQHQFGTTPPVFHTSRQASGDLFLNNRAYTFQIRRARQNWLDEVRLWEITAAGSSELSMAGIRSDWNRRTSFGVAYPEKIECLPHLRLSSPRVVSSSLGSAQLVYQAQVEGSHERTETRCEAVMPARFACPLMGRWIERSIHQVTSKT